MRSTHVERSQAVARGVKLRVVEANELDRTKVSIWTIDLARGFDASRIGKRTWSAMDSILASVPK